MQEVFQGQEEEEYKLANASIPEGPNQVSNCGLKTSLITVKGLLLRKNL